MSPRLFSARGVRGAREQGPPLSIQYHQPPPSQKRTCRTTTPLNMSCSQLTVTTSSPSPNPPPSTAFLADSVTAVCGSPLLGRELARRLHQRNLASRLGRLGPGRRAPSGIDGVPVLAGWLGDVGHGSLLSNLQESGQLKRKPG